MASDTKKDSKPNLRLGKTYCEIPLFADEYYGFRITPKEWRNPYPCLEDPDELENQFSLGNSFWFTIGAFLQQGSEIAAM